MTADEHDKRGNDTESPDAAAPSATSTTARPKRRRLGWLIALVIVVVVGVGLWIAGDTFARSYAKQYVRGQIIEIFELPADTPLDVTIGPGSLIAQAIGGKIDSVTVAGDNLSFGGISGDVVIDATGIPLDSAVPLDTLRVRLTAGNEEVQALSGYLSGIDLESIELLDSSIAIGTEYTFFTFTVPIGVELEPAVVDGQLSFQPTTITVNGNDISVADLTAGPLGGIAGPLLGAQSFCVSEYLPQAIVLTDAHIADGELVIELSGDGAALGGASISTMGTCPPQTGG